MVNYFHADPSNKIVFCYGSNMSSKRLKKRCPSAKPVSIAKLKAYQFSFNKISMDSSAKANITFTGNEDDLVWGVLFQLDHNDKKILDRFEGLGKGYDERRIAVKKPDHGLVEVLTYLCTDSKYINSQLAPYDWYKTHCIKGAEEYNLPTHYSSYLNSFLSIQDNKKERCELEMSLYK